MQFVRQLYIFFKIFDISPFNQFTIFSVSFCEVDSAKLHLHHSAPCDSVWVRLRCALVSLCFIASPEQEAKARLEGAAQVCPGTMDYQQKLAEKLVILNERGTGVLIRMNYIKKVRASSKSHGSPQKRETRKKGTLFFCHDTLTLTNNVSLK